MVLTQMVCNCNLLTELLRRKEIKVSIETPCECGMRSDHVHCKQCGGMIHDLKYDELIAMDRYSALQRK